MNEPLKGKTKVLRIDSIAVDGVVKNNQKMVFARDYDKLVEDIKSAVEWLKEQFIRNKDGSDNPFSNTFIEKKINKAFEDVTKVKDKKIEDR